MKPVLTKDRNLIFVRIVGREGKGGEKKKKSVREVSTGIIIKSRPYRGPEEKRKNLTPASSLQKKRGKGTIGSPQGKEGSTTRRSETVPGCAECLNGSTRGKRGVSQREERNRSACAEAALQLRKNLWALEKKRGGGGEFFNTDWEIFVQPQNSCFAQYIGGSCKHRKNAGREEKKCISALRWDGACTHRVKGANS